MLSLLSCLRVGEASVAAHGEGKPGERLQRSREPRPHRWRRFYVARFRRRPPRSSEPSPEGAGAADKTSATLTEDTATEDSAADRRSRDILLRLPSREKSLSVRRGLVNLSIQNRHLKEVDTRLQPDSFGGSWLEPDAVPSAVGVPDDGPTVEDACRSPLATAARPAQREAEVVSVRLIEEFSEPPTRNDSMATYASHSELSHSQSEPIVQRHRSQLRGDSLRFLRTLGSGTFAFVQLAVDTESGEHMAVKVIDGKSHRVQASSEIAILAASQRCQCRNIVEYYGSFQAEGKIFIAMEYMDVGTVDMLYRGTHVRRLPEPIVRAVAWQTLRALVFIHEQCGQVHRDVKPSNLLVNSVGEVKLADFGLCSSPMRGRRAGAAVGRPDPVPVRAGKFVGTCLFMAPEMLRANPYDARADVYSLGVALVECITGRNPYYDDFLRSRGHLDLIMTLLERGAPVLDATVSLGADGRDFLHQCLQEDLLLRATSRQLLQHRWFQGLRRAGNDRLRSQGTAAPAISVRDAPDTPSAAVSRTRPPIGAGGDRASLDRCKAGVARLPNGNAVEHTTVQRPTVAAVAAPDDAGRPQSAGAGQPHASTPVEPQAELDETVFMQADASARQVIRSFLRLLGLF
ncbi:hypothetical protein CDCA_CDCA02G0520 [Cyanidium caldarium]|uniref:mitogen-activated protein kinase kinase n=1 Tax=Cyanidium caldarium TaxID=2771 RepID=A0AAV9IQZ2_CYACA|nr:hypothetical protein CDCA_CDCA02G0520 [Cyanidium caldarium]